MDIAEIREKAKQLKDGGEVPAEETTSIREVETRPEPVPQVELPEDNETQTPTYYSPEVEILPNERFFDESLVPDLLKPVPYVDEEAENSNNEEGAEEEVEAIVFSLDNEDYAVDIHQVKEIIKVKELTVVPKAPKDIMGLISLRGVVIPVMNLRERFGMPMQSSGERIIIVRDGTGLLGLLVDTVRHVVRAPEKSIEPAPSINTIDGELIRGIGRHKGGMFILLDIQKMLELK